MTDSLPVKGSVYSDLFRIWIAPRQMLEDAVVAGRTKRHVALAVGVFFALDWALITITQWIHSILVGDRIDDDLTSPLALAIIRLCLALTSLVSLFICARGLVSGEDELDQKNRVLVFVYAVAFVLVGVKVFLFLIEWADFGLLYLKITSRYAVYAVISLRVLIIILLFFMIRLSYRYVLKNESIASFLFFSFLCFAVNTIIVSLVYVILLIFRGAV